VKGGWEGILIWQKGVFLPFAITFVIKVEKIVMDDVTLIVDYENIQ
jgi:hypothetical protein